ncbi:MAG TPA: hypothetical protein VHG09_06785 [Longimicrobiales bacterium]|nr:hypothetical protein [Longimicrobiales bacterium]
MIGTRGVRRLRDDDGYSGCFDHRRRSARGAVSWYHVRARRRARVEAAAAAVRLRLTIICRRGVIWLAVAVLRGRVGMAGAVVTCDFSLVGG